MSKMIGNKGGDSSGLSPGFDTNIYEKLDDMFFNPELEFLVCIEDNYLKQAVVQFLLDSNLQQKSTNFKNFEYMFISLDLGTFNFIERPNYKDKRIYELPYDWTELMSEIKNYISENPIQKKEIVEKNSDSWSTPIGDEII